MSEIYQRNKNTQTAIRFTEEGKVNINIEINHAEMEIPSEQREDMTNFVGGTVLVLREHIENPKALPIMRRKLFEAATEISHLKIEEAKAA